MDSCPITTTTTTQDLALDDVRTCGRCWQLAKLINVNDVSTQLSKLANFSLSWFIHSERT